MTRLAPALARESRTRIGRFMRTCRGATAIEYALIAGLMATALLASLPALRDEVSALFETIEAALPASEAEEG